MKILHLQKGLLSITLNTFIQHINKFIQNPDNGLDISTIISEFNFEMFKNKTIIFVEGVIGAGKSTLLSNLKTDKIEIIHEPVFLWQNLVDDDGVNLLQIFYNANGADLEVFVFQIVALISRLTRIFYSYNQNKDIYVIERSHLADNVFFSFYRETNKYTHIYDQIYNIVIAKLETISSKFYFLEHPFEEIMRRIKMRNRKEEINIPEQYIKDLILKYNQLKISVIDKCISQIDLDVLLSYKPHAS